MKKLLDVGCGPGTITNIGFYNTYKKTYKIYGIDFLEDNIKLIKQRFPFGTFEKAKAEKLPYREKYFDMVISHHLLEHVKNPETAIKEMARVSKKGSILHIAVPHERFEHIISHQIPHYMAEGHHHEQIFTQEKIISLLEKQKFKIISVKNDKWPIFVLVFCLTKLSRFTKKVSMQVQTGVFLVGKDNYLANKSFYPIYSFLYNVLALINEIFFFLNSIIPFELQITARKE